MSATAPSLTARSAPIGPRSPAGSSSVVMSVKIPKATVTTAARADGAALVGGPCSGVVDWADTATSSLFINLDI